MQNWPAQKWDVIGIWLIPIVAGASQLLAMSCQSEDEPKRGGPMKKAEKNESVIAGTKTMLYTMPIISIWFAFVGLHGIAFTGLRSAIFGNSGYDPD
jgi:membrane protein insertase Oxa1/YidC/SpoIIIJ